MPDPLATPWSGHRGLPLPTVLPSAAGVPAAARVEVTAGAVRATGSAVRTVLVTPWSSSGPSGPGTPGAALPPLPRAPVLPRPRPAARAVST